MLVMVLEVQVSHLQPITVSTLPYPTASTRHLAALGALAIILGAGADPFAQQLVHYYQAGVVDSSQSAWVSRAVNYTAFSFQNFATGKFAPQTLPYNGPASELMYLTNHQQPPT